MGCGAAEATGLGFVCFVVDLGFFCFINFPILPPPPQDDDLDMDDMTEAGDGENGFF